MRVVVREERIAAVEELGAALVVGDLSLDLTGCTLEPGGINAHTHLYSGLVPFGLPAPVPTPTSFVEILERLWWKLDRALDAELLRASARYYVATALLHGTTTLIDHHESPAFIEGSLDVLADACEELGARAVLTYGATERNGGEEEARAGLAECARFARRRTSASVRAAIGLHASFTVSDATIVRAAELARELRLPLHVHMAEGRADVEDARRRGHAGPLERFESLGAVVPESILAHGVHLDRDQVTRVAAAAVWLVQNPRSNQGNGVGYPRALAATDRVALGTDGYPADMRAERAALLERGRENGESVQVLEARCVAARRLVEHSFGTRFDLVSGGVADLVVRDESGAVRDVVVGGRVVVRGGALARGDLAEITRRAEEAASRLGARMSA